MLAELPDPDRPATPRVQHDPDRPELPAPRQPRQPLVLPLDGTKRGPRHARSRSTPTADREPADLPTADRAPAHLPDADIPDVLGGPTRLPGLPRRLPHLPHLTSLDAGSPGVEELGSDGSDHPTAEVPAGAGSAADTSRDFGTGPVPPFPTTAVPAAAPEVRSDAAPAVLDLLADLDTLTDLVVLPGEEQSGRGRLHSPPVPFPNSSDVPRPADAGEVSRCSRYVAAITAIEELACAPAHASLLLELCVERARGLARACGAAVELFEEGEELLFAATSGILGDYLGQVQQVTGTLCGAALRSGAAVCSDDAQSDPRGCREFAVQLGARSMVSLPLSRGRRRIGVLLVCSRERNMFTDEDVALLQRLARVAGARLDLALTRDARKYNDEALEASRQKYRTVLASIDQGILVIDEYDRVSMVNPAAERILGQPAYDLLGQRPDWVMLHEDGSPMPWDERPVQVALREQRPVPEVTMQVVRNDGESRWVSLNAAPLPHAAEDGRRGAVVCFSDITERRREAERLRHSQRLLAETQRLARVGSWEMQPGDEFLVWTDEMYRLFGLPAQSVPISQELHLSLIHPEDRPMARASFAEAFSRVGAFELAHRVILGTGEVRHLHVTGEVEHGPDGEVRAWGSAQDVTDRLRVQNTLQRMAMTDPLTGLGNRLLLVEQLRMAVARLARSHAHLAVIAMDLDGLKAVNDTHGHATGDDLLRETARRMRSAVREQDVVSRLGGDEFVVLCGDLTPEHAVALAARIVAEIAEPFRFPSGIVARAGASVGVTVTNDPDADVDRLLDTADRLLYEAKGAGGSRYVLDPTMFPHPTLDSFGDAYGDSYDDLDAVG